MIYPKLAMRLVKVIKALCHMKINKQFIDLIMHLNLNLITMNKGIEVKTEPIPIRRVKQGDSFFSI